MEQTPKDEFALDRRKFLALLSAAGVWLHPTLAGLGAPGAIMLDAALEVID